MGRYSELYKEVHKRDPTDFPSTLNPILEVGKEYRLRLLGEPRKVRAGFGKITPLVEVKYLSKRYTLYLSWVDLLNRFALLEEQEEEENGTSLVGKTVILKMLRPYRFSLRLDKS